ncbi:hypothetical protein [Dysgonomonas sp. 520]|uniref:hypothetical protein n=1 Tax=Dysgonomonas sp. 520 TaxID=2302931 RepID=UPI0013D7AF2A|nr:hypothetical protein [Dysgonomonas sp. 520]NDW09155.1 hypothetical protein [Dysgonomonas sp. 520]
MNHTNRYICTIFNILILSFSVTLSGQIGISDESKKMLLKSVNPFNNQGADLFKQQLKPQNSVLENKYLDAYNNMKAKSVLNNTDVDKYKIDKHVYTYSSKIPANLIPPGSYVPVYMGGHFHLVSTAGTLMSPSGLSLTGWSPPRLSDKSKTILRNVFGMEVED